MGDFILELLAALANGFSAGGDPRGAWKPILIALVLACLGVMLFKLL